MLTRLGNVLFGLGILCGIAWLLIVIAVTMTSDGVEPPGVAIMAALGLVFPGAGWTLRYILAGRQ